MANGTEKIKLAPIIIADEEMEIEAPSILSDKEIDAPDWNSYKKKTQSYLDRDVFSNKSLTGDILTSAAKRTYERTGKYIPPEFALSQAQQEGSLAMKGRSPETNPFNVGEWDEGTKQTFKTTQEGTNAYYDLIADDYMTGGGMGALLKNFVNKAGSRYATDPTYEKKISGQMDYINKFWGKQEAPDVIEDKDMEAPSILDDKEMNDVPELRAAPEGKAPRETISAKEWEDNVSFEIDNMLVERDIHRMSPEKQNQFQKIGWTVATMGFFLPYDVAMNILVEAKKDPKSAARMIARTQMPQITGLLPQTDEEVEFGKNVLERMIGTQKQGEASDLIPVPQILSKMRETPSTTVPGLIQRTAAKVPDDVASAILDLGTKVGVSYGFWRALKPQQVKTFEDEIKRKMKLLDEYEKKGPDILKNTTLKTDIEKVAKRASEEFGMNYLEVKRNLTDKLTHMIAKAQNTSANFESLYKLYLAPGRLEKFVFGDSVGAAVRGFTQIRNYKVPTDLLLNIGNMVKGGATIKTAIDTVSKSQNIPKDVIEEAYKKQQPTAKGGEIKHPAQMSEEEFNIEEAKGMGTTWKNAMKLPDGTIIESNTKEHGDMIPDIEEEFDIDAKDMERGWTWKGFPKEQSYIGVPDVEKAKGSFYQAYKNKYQSKLSPKEGGVAKGGELEGEARKYKNVEEFKALGFDAILKDLRGVEQDSVVTIPTDQVEIIWKDDYSNAKETARKTYNPKTAEPVELIYDIKSGKYKLDDGHNRFVSAEITGKPIKGIVTKIEGNLEELASIYQKEKGVSIQEIFNQSKLSPKEVAKAPEVKEPKRKTITGEILSRGGLDPDKLSKDYNIKELREFGLGHILKKGGKSLDDIAKTFQEEGLISIPKNMNPGDYLIEQIKTRKGRLLPVSKSDQAIAKEYLSDAKEKGYSEEEIDEALLFEPEKYEAEIGKERLKRINEVRKIFKKSPILSPGKVKPAIHQVTGLKKSIDTIVTNEYRLLTEQIRVGEKGRKEGYALGKQEIRTKEAIKRKVQSLTDSIKSMGQRKLPVEYKDQVDAILEQYDLKKRTEKTKKKRVSITEFVDEMREQGDLAFVPKNFFKDYGTKKTLDEMTLEDLQLLHDQIKVLVTVGSNIGKLISFEKELDLEETVDRMTKTIYNKAKKSQPTEEELRYKPPSMRKKSEWRKKMDAMSRYFSGHRKIENLTKVLDIWEEVWMPLQRGTNTELKKGGEMSEKFKQIFALISEDSVEMMTETIQVAGMQDPITRWEAVGVALNSENTGNVERLTEGNQYTAEQIKAIKNELSENEKKFVDEVFKLIDSYWTDTETNTIKATGVRPKKIEQGRYFPIKTDYSQDIDAQIRESQKDVMREVFSKAFLERGFTKSRIGGKGPVDLNVLPVILKHLNDVIHYNAFVLPMRDVQKIIHHPKFKKAIIDVMGEATYGEFKPWLADTVNPKTLSPQNIYEVAASTLRRNSTAAILGFKVSVSLLQAGSFLQTVRLIGLKSAMGGVADFYKNPRAATRWVYSKSEEIKNRSSLWDRELKDWMESQHAKQILKGLPSDAKSALFAMIRSVDFLTVMPTWIGAYNKEISEHGNEQIAIDGADSVTRMTQPMGSIKDLPRMLRGRPFQKFFTMFKSFYTTMHNQIVDIKDEYRFSDDPPLDKTGKATLALFWVWIAPSLLATWIRSGFKEKDPKEYVKGIVTFPLQGLFLISDLVSATTSGFEMGVPALKGFKELYYGVKGKKGYTKAKHFTKAIGTFQGAPVDALWTFGEGMADLITGKTTDPRRLVYSKYALKEKEEDAGKPGRKYIKRESNVTRPRKYIRRKR